ncbi:MAG: hypothetical protein K2W96_18635 [Gemmataceae bacterium]|nr:hypothetical protein [Gemmataceae bacterium]
MTLTDENGRPVTLGAQLGKGGEGAVFAVQGDVSQVAKLYSPLPSSEQADKLRAMVRRPQMPAIAWPSRLLFRSGRLAGSLMPSATDCKSGLHLYNPRLRPAAFPQADFAFLLHAARNLATAFERLHQAGIIAGDVNESNAMFSAKAEAFLIDCDSFQMREGSRLFTCNVGKLEYTPPELQGRPFRGVERTPDHDRFGIAVLIFQLLFLGRHPFAGRWLGQGDMSLERAIRELRFAYGNRAAALLVAMPLQAPPLSLVPPEAASLFERAFTSLQGRPSAGEWLAALDRLRGSLRACLLLPGHTYPQHLGSCPWCVLMGQGTRNLFVTPLAAAAAFDLGSVWARIEAARPPMAYRLPALPQMRPTPLPANVPPSLPVRPIARIPPRPPPPVPPPMPAKPAILQGKRSPPASQIAKPDIEDTVVGSSTAQQWLSAACLAFAFATLVVILLAAIAGPRATGFLFGAGGLCLVPALICGILWRMQERDRRTRQAIANEDYEAQMRAWRTARQQEQEHWEARNARLEREARRRYDAEVHGWNERRDELHREWEQRAEAQEAEATQAYDRAVREWERLVELAREEAKKRRRVRDQAESGYRRLRDPCDTIVQTADTAFRRRKEQAREARRRYERLTRERTDALSSLHWQAREAQFQQFLDSHLIAAASIPGIGEARIQALATFNIETADDITLEGVLEVPGIGSKLADNLLRWRQQIERRFTYNPAAGVPASYRQAAEARFALPIRQAEQELMECAAALHHLSTDAATKLKACEPRLLEAARALAQAEADLLALPPGI